MLILKGRMKLITEANCRTRNYLQEDKRKSQACKNDCQMWILHLKAAFQYNEIAKTKK